jgi:hypothetical protein
MIMVRQEILKIKRDKNDKRAGMEPEKRRRFVKKPIDNKISKEWIGKFLSLVTRSTCKLTRLMNSFIKCTIKKSQRTPGVWGMG